jgi:ParB/RepB/Spo0J family partition protein
MTNRRQTPRMLPLRILLDHNDNVRTNVRDLDELAASIRAQGLLQPIVVTPHRRDGHYLILAGHRRAAAARSIPLDNVPCLIRDDAGSTADHIALMLVENMQRSNLTAVEKARGMKRLVDAGQNQTQIARRLGLTPSAVNSYLLLLDLSDEELAKVEAGEVTVGHARAVAKASRARTRVDHGTPNRGRPPVVEPGHFTKNHPLAAQVEALCTHTGRPYPGRAVNACGQCWEQVIRDDASRSTA